MRDLLIRVTEKQFLAQFFRFFLVGALAFSTDALVLQSLVSIADWSPYTARIPSASLAIAVSWLLNRSFTFRLPKQHNVAKTIVTHVAATLISFMINLMIYWGLLSSFESLAPYPIIALSVASAVGLMINFLLAKYWVFSHRS